MAEAHCATRDPGTHLLAVGVASADDRSSCQIDRRPNYSYSAPGVRHQLVLIARDDDRGARRKGRFEILVVLHVTAIRYPDGRLKTHRGVANQAEDMIAPHAGHRADKFGTTENLDDFRLDCGGKGDHILRPRSWQSTFGHTVPLDRSAHQ